MTRSPLARILPLALALQVLAVSPARAESPPARPWHSSVGVLLGSRWGLRPGAHGLPPRRTGMEVTVSRTTHAASRPEAGFYFEGVFALSDHVAHRLDHLGLGVGMRLRAGVRTELSAGLLAAYWVEHRPLHHGDTAGGLSASAAVELWEGEGLMTRVLLRAEVLAHDREAVVQSLVGVGARWL